MFVHQLQRKSHSRPCRTQDSRQTVSCRFFIFLRPLFSPIATGFIPGHVTACWLGKPLRCVRCIIYPCGRSRQRPHTSPPVVHRCCSSGTRPALPSTGYHLEEFPKSKKTHATQDNSQQLGEIIRWHLAHEKLIVHVCMRQRTLQRTQHVNVLRTSHKQVTKKLDFT